MASLRDFQEDSVSSVFTTESSLESSVSESSFFLTEFRDEMLIRLVLKSGFLSTSQRMLCCIVKNSLKDSKCCGKSG